VRRLTLLVFLLLPLLAAAQEWPTTRAESSNYTETSTYADVIEFLKGLQRMGAPIAVQTIGKSAEGRDIPLVIASRPLVATAAEARRMGKPIVYVQANIHAGEIEGKEAILMLLRDMASGKESGDLLDQIVILATPIYNADGNEKFGPVERNRPSQDGPAQVGLRPNGQGLDLNRDAIKAVAPETQAVLRHVYNAWDPEVMMDLHTTNGTRHGFHLTYSPPLNPNSELVRPISLDLLKTVQAKLETKGISTFDYGNVERRGELQAWFSYGHEARYGTNYVGLRNRIGILSEAASFRPFDDRVMSTYHFVLETLRYVSDHVTQIAQVVSDADLYLMRGGIKPQWGVRFDFATVYEREVPLERRGTARAPRPTTPTDLEMVRMPIYDRFVATRFADMPAAYLVPASEERTLELLRLHGVVVERLLEPWEGEAQTFTIGEFRMAERPFQNVRLIELDGTFSRGTARAEAGTFLVRTTQPLGLLAFHILEPESTDGAVAWGFLGDGFAVGGTFPILKATRPVRAATDRAG
jgi:hypothetical protein